MHVSYPNLFDSEIQVNRKTRRALTRYLGGLMLHPGKKNCSAIAKVSDQSHDMVYDFFECHIENKLIMQSFLHRLLLLLPTGNGLWYVNIDETMIDKVFSEKIEAVAKNWSGTHNDTVKGFSIVVAVITNGKITIPITFKTWYSAKDFPDRHKTRIELAQGLMSDIHKMIPGIMFLMDGAFSSEGMLSFCKTHKMRYCMRFHSNKKVIISGALKQLRNHELIKLSSNKKGRLVTASYRGVDILIVAFRRKERKGAEKIVYLVTSEKSSPKKTIQTYKRRWPIEKVFRTTKQHLGLKDCQARSASKQEAHIFAIFVAFAFLEIQKVRHHAKNPEQILHKIRRGKHGKLRFQFETFCESTYALA